MKKTDDLVIRGETKLTPSTAKVLVEALPYIQQLAGSTIVIKLGGNAMIDDKLKEISLQNKQFTDKKENEKLWDYLKRE